MTNFSDSKKAENAIILAAVQTSGIEESKLVRQGALKEAKRLHTQASK